MQAFHCSWCMLDAELGCCLLLWCAGEFCLFYFLVLCAEGWLGQEPSSASGGAAPLKRKQPRNGFNLMLCRSCMYQRCIKRAQRRALLILLQPSSDHREEHAAHKEKYEAGTAMENLSGLFPDLSEERQDILQRAFTADATYLENQEKMNQSFWESLVKGLAATEPPILNPEEKSNLLNSCSVLPGGYAACLKAIEKKGVRAMAVLYLLLKTTDPSGYRQLPSSKGKDEKLKLLKRLERNLILSQGEEEAEDSSHESMDEDTQDSDGEDLGRHRTEGYLLKGMPAEVVPYSRDSEITRREDSAADGYENKTPHLQQWALRWMGIRKDDEFFHFVILCFAIGALLICYYYYKDWTISLGIGLVTFASLETTGIYFGLVYRIRSVFDSFVPLIDKFRPTGLWKAA